MASLINKGRKPKFELHLTIHDLSNVPFKQGSSTVKWQISHSMHAEHRGRTEKASTDWLTHRVTYNYKRIVPVRISIDRANNLAECPIEFEVLHDFPAPAGAKPEKTSVGFVRLNLSEYIEESEIYSRRRNVGAVGASRIAGGVDNAKEKVSRGLHSSHGGRHKRNSSNNSYRSTADSAPGEVKDAIEEHNESPGEPVVEEGIVRRYLMHDSKVNSTLKIGILMVQIDGERHYAAPSLRSAPMFGGIAGILGDQESYSLPAPEPSSTESALTATLGDIATFSVIGAHDASELVDMYRRALAASYSSMPGELPADECIEDIFMGGDGKGSALYSAYPSSGHESIEKSPTRHGHRQAIRDDESNNTSASGSPSDEFNPATLNPSPTRRVRSHMRNHSAGSEKSVLTVTNIWGRNAGDNGSSLAIPNGSYGHSSRHRNGGPHRYPTSIPSAPTRGPGLPNDMSISSGGGSGSAGGLNQQHFQQFDNDSIEGHHESILRSIGLKGSRGLQDEGGSVHSGQRSGSMGSLLSQHNGRGNGRRHSRHRSRECSEENMREDLVAWRLPGQAR